MINIKEEVSQLQYITVSIGAQTQVLSYEVYGQPLHTAPIVLVNHALTGNSTVCGDNGWWKDLIGFNKAIDANKYTILAFNIPGNGYDAVLIDDYKSVSVKQVSELFLAGLSALKIDKLFAIIGGSLGGGIAWQMAVLQPKITEHLIPVATHNVASAWLIANCLVQETLLLHSDTPIHDARLHAMLCYRTPESLKSRFNRTVNQELGIFNIESWLLYHGKRLQERFQLSAYKVMNNLLRSIAVEDVSAISAKVTLVSIDTDLFFTANDIKDTYTILKELNKEVTYAELKSIHGHDAFLIEYEQLTEIIKPIFK